MNIFECIVLSLCIIVVGLWGLVYLAGKNGLLEDDKKNTKKAYRNNIKKTNQKVVKEDKKDKE